MYNGGREGNAASGLDEQTLAMITDEVLGSWGLLKEWRQQVEAGESGGAS